MRYRLVGGPCNGTLSRDFTVRPFTGYAITCQAHEYKFGTGDVFHDAGLWATNHPGAPGGFGALQLGPAWTRLMRAYGVKVPNALRRSRAARKRMRRVVR